MSTFSILAPKNRQSTPVLCAVFKMQVRENLYSNIFYVVIFWKLLSFVTMIMKVR